MDIEWSNCLVYVKYHLIGIDVFCCRRIHVPLTHGLRVSSTLRSKYVVITFFGVNFISLVFFICSAKTHPHYE